MFKPKPPKAIVSSSNDTCKTTLDTHHMNKLEGFHKNDVDVIPELKKQKQEIKEKLRNYSGSIETKLDLKDKLKELRAKISDLKKLRNKYFLDNCGYIFDYFEGKKKIEEGKNKTRSLETFFKVKSVKESPEQAERSTVQKYLNNIDTTTIDLNDFARDKTKCEGCGVGELIAIDHEGIMVCTKCYKSVRYLVEHEKPSYKEPPKEVCFYAYKRINHFREILAQFQAKETTQIPEIVLESIKLQIKKERFELKQLTNKKAKEILKKLGYNKYYEHIPFIKDKLGIKPPIMSSELEETLCNLFMDIQAPYAKYCPHDRVNFLNYYYTVYKLCELLDQRQFLPYFPMLKDREKRIEQDEIWQKICHELGWEFIPTI